jgi:Ca-activated chloride channel homolog
VGNQLVIVGRYRNGIENTTIRLTGVIDGAQQSIVYEGMDFTERAGGESFIARLWATRRIGELLNNIRLNGENAELVDSIVSLSVRYGIITPYTSFLIDENDILTQTGRAAAAEDITAQTANAAPSGASAVDAADAFGSMEAAAAPLAMPTMTAAGTPTMVDPNAPIVAGVPRNPIQTVGDKTFLWQDGVWTDTTFAPDTMTTQQVVFLSDAYFQLLVDTPALSEYFALGERVIVVLDGVAYEVVSE